MLPLLPLTRDGGSREAVEEMIKGLQAAGKEDLLPLGYAFAALVFGRDSDKQWLKRRFDMLHEVLEESWAYQEMMEKGMEKGMAQGIEKGEAAALRSTLVRFVEKCFPALTPLARQEAERIKAPEALRRTSMRSLTHKQRRRSELPSQQRQEKLPIPPHNAGKFA